MHENEEMQEIKKIHLKNYDIGNNKHNTTHAEKKINNLCMNSINICMD